MITITRDNLMNVLSTPKRRAALFKAMRAEQGTNLPLSNLYEELGRSCVATAEQLESVIRSLANKRKDHSIDWLLRPLVFHPNTPESALFFLFDMDCCISALGHRGYPQSLLEKMVENHRYSEAITTLALRYYNQPDYPTEAFAAFLLEHREDYMLQGNMVRAKNLLPDKAEVVSQIFKDRNTRRGVTPSSESADLQPSDQ